uniref:sialate O-acetylesterase n=1 Tax=uncultured Draconibacterium sp. TaxID=1573823 RepID=UPI003216C9D8
MKVKTLMLFVTGLLFTQLIYAEIKLPAIISSNMVLQRNATVKLWGWAEANEEISVNFSWLSGTKRFGADDEGFWSVEVKTTNSKELQTIRFRSKTSDIKLDNIVFGEVWLCSGQSNMWQSLKGYHGEPIFGANMAIAKSDNSNLRLFTVGRAGSKVPVKDFEEYNGWEQASPENVSGFSALAYFFGQQLQQVLDVPVGLIHTSWGGSSVQAWMSNEMLGDYQQINLDEVEITKKTNIIPTALFNSMINPLIPYNIKGVIWYQGESNRHEPEVYKKLFPVMVKDWRQRWNLGDFPFYYVQIAPFSYGNNDAFQTAANTAFLREAQLQSLNSIPNSGMAITMDIGAEHSIHPPQKKEAADRLLFIALNQTYGYQTIDYAAPILDSQKVKDRGIVLKFKNAETGLYAYNKLDGFEIAGDDKVFYPADARIISRNEVFVISDKVSKPVAVRYAWRNWIVGTLYDTNLLPASSFRTDNWDDATRGND